MCSTTELLHLSDSVLRNFDAGMLTPLIALDFSKAFDTVDPDLFLAKLHSYGIASSALSFIRSFLVNCSQRVLYTPRPTFSPLHHVRAGVPQGSGSCLCSSPALFTADLASVPLN